MKNKLTVGIIGAMDCEVNKLKSRLVNEKIYNAGKLTFHFGDMYNHNAVIVKSGVGKVNAAICTQIIIDKFNPDFIINTGIAGGVANEIKVGDIVAGTELVQYDFDASAIGYAKGYMCTGINPDKPTKYYSDKDLISKFEKAVSIAAPSLKIHKGVIATGDCFVSDLKRKKEIQETFNALAAEMEGAAIAQSAAANNVPFIIVRAVSDLADDNAAQEHFFVETEMAELSSASIEYLLKHI